LEFFIVNAGKYLLKSHNVQDLMTIRLRSSGLMLLLVMLAGVSFSQVKPPDDGETIRVETNLIEVPVAVYDRNGGVISGLKRENFILYEDGKKQEIAEFFIAQTPFEIALLLDTSGSARGELPLIRRAAHTFIDSLRPGDKVALIAYNTVRTPEEARSASVVLSGLTSDRAKLRAAIDRVGTSNSTPYYDSLLQIADEVFNVPDGTERRGRRAIVALTDGVDSASGADFELAKEKLLEHGITAFFVRADTRDFFEENLLGDCQTATKFSGAQIRRYYRTIQNSQRTERAASFCQLGDFERLAVSKRLYEVADAEMERLAKASGGMVLPLADIADARLAFKKVADVIGTTVSLGYYPSNDKKDGTFRKITVELKGMPAGASVKAREGYSAPKN
jgi:VWFA-related protein